MCLYTPTGQYSQEYPRSLPIWGLGWGVFSSDILIILVICKSNQTECVFVKAPGLSSIEMCMHGCSGFLICMQNFSQNVLKTKSNCSLHFLFMFFRFLFGFACLCVLLSFFFISFKFSHHFYFYWYVELNKDHGWDFPLLLALWQKLSTWVNVTWHCFAPNCQELLKKSVKMLWQLVTTILTCCCWRTLNIYVVLLLLFTHLLNFNDFFSFGFFSIKGIFLFSLVVYWMWNASNLLSIRSFCHLFRLQVWRNSQ